MIKQLLLTVSMLTLVLGMAGCQNTTSDTTSQTPTSGSPETVSNTPPPPPPSPNTTPVSSPAPTLATQPPETESSDSSKRLGMGTVKEIVQGDIMCYVTLEDQNGVTHNLGATFEICAEADTYLNKKVSLSYTEANVNDCQSNEPCGKTRQETLISTLEIID